MWKLKMGDWPVTGTDVGFPTLPQWPECLLIPACILSYICVNVHLTHTHTCTEKSTPWATQTSMPRRPTHCQPTGATCRPETTHIHIHLHLLHGVAIANIHPRHVLLPLATHTSHIHMDSHSQLLAHLAKGWQVSD